MEKYLILPYVFISEEEEVVDEMDKGGKPASTCNLCPKPKVLKNADAVRQHQDMKHKDAKFRCSYKRCQLRFYSKIDRKNHKDCHYG